MEERIIKALSSLTGIRESKLSKLKEVNVLYDIIDKPNIIEPTNIQLQKLNLLNEFIINLEIAREFKHKNQINFSNSNEAGKYFKHLIGSKKDKEIFLLAMFDKKDNLMKIRKMSEGTIKSAVVYPRDIVKEVLNTKCKSVMFCHNHPSGVTNPSNADITLTKNLLNILEPLKVEVKDHLIVGDDIFSFLKDGRLNSAKGLNMKVADDENIYNLNNYYEQHLNKYLESLASLTGISKEKMNNYLEGKDDRNKYALQIIENPELLASKLGLSSPERKKLGNLKEFISNIKELKREDNNSITNVDGIRYFLLNSLKENKMENENLYITLFDNRLKKIGFEKLSYKEGDDIVYNSRDILAKSLAYEANGVILSISSSNIDNSILSDIAQNTINMLAQLEIKLLDIFHIKNGKTISLEEKGYLPYTNFGQPEYRKMKITEKLEISQDEDEDEDEDEWEFEL